MKYPPNSPRWLDPNQASRIYTIGYGLTSREEFINRLSIAFPDKDAIIIDIRKEGSGSRNPGPWANWGDDMKATPELHNEYGSTKAGLMQFRDDLIDGTKRKELDQLVSLLIDTHPTKYCLLCCERKPFTGKFTPRTKIQGVRTSWYIGWETWTGGPNCHRLIVAKQIGQRMRIGRNLEWFTKHLYTEKG